MENYPEPQSLIPEQIEASEMEMDHLMKKFKPSSCQSFNATMLGLEPYVPFAQLRPAARSYQRQGVRQHGPAIGECPHDEDCLYPQMKFIVSS